MQCTALSDRRLSQFPPRALIFDMDGTIVDTRPYHMAAWHDLVARKVLPECYFRIAQSSFGKTNWAIFDEWFEGNRDGRWDYEALSADKEATFRRLIAGHVRPRPGFMQLLAQARRKGLKIGLATSGPRENALFLLGQLGVAPLFDAVVWGDARIRSKPHPDSFILAARRLGVAPSRAMGFEDSCHGFWSVRRAGMTLVAIAEWPALLVPARRWTPYAFLDFRPAIRLLNLANEKKKPQNEFSAYCRYRPI